MLVSLQISYSRSHLLTFLGLVGIGLYIQKATNVIIRNIISESVLAKYGDAIAIQASKNVWVDHVYVFFLSKCCADILSYTITVNDHNFGHLNIREFEQG